MSFPPPIRSKEQENVRLLAIFHYVVGGLGVLFACFPLIYLALGLAFIFSPEMQKGMKGDMSPATFGWIFVTIGAIGFLIGEAISICIIVAGRKLAKHQSHTFAFVMACVECLFMPFGTVLGVFTIITLSKPEVKQLFGKLPGSGGVAPVERPAPPAA